MPRSTFASLVRQSLGNLQPLSQVTDHDELRSMPLTIWVDWPTAAARTQALWHGSQSIDTAIASEHKPNVCSYPSEWPVSAAIWFT